MEKLKKQLQFNQGSNYFRQRLVLSLLSARPVKIEEIRSKADLNIGVTPYEVSFMQLLEKLSNGSKFKINETGTEVRLIPGALLGDTVSHQCDTSRPLSYYLEPVLLLAPFCKKPLKLTVRGKLQNDINGYNSVYKLKHAALPILEHFGLEPSLEIKFRSFDDAEVYFTCTVKKQLLTLRNQFNQECGKVKKVRGVAYGFRVSPQILNRVIFSSKQLFENYLKDVFIINDPIKSSISRSPGYGFAIYCETTKGIVYAADGFIGKEEKQTAEQTSKVVSAPKLDDVVKSPKKAKFDLFPDEDDDANKSNDSEEEDSNNSIGIKKRKNPNRKPDGSEETSDSTIPSDLPTNPEDLGLHVSRQLLQEICSQSRVDSVYQWLVLAFMALGPRDVSSIILGRLTPFTIQFLRDLKTFFSVTFRIESLNESDDSDEEDSKKRKVELHKLSCLGCGYINLNKTTV